MYQGCQNPMIRIERVEPDGRYFWQATVNGTVAVGQFGECMKKQYQATPYEQWVKVHSAATPTATTPSSLASRVTPTSSTANTPQLIAKTAVATSTGSRDPMLKPTWAVGDEWSYRWQSPQGKGTFVWVVDRFERVNGIDSVVVKSGTRETFYRRDDGAGQESADLRLYVRVFERTDCFGFSIWIDDLKRALGLAALR